MIDTTDTIEDTAADTTEDTSDVATCSTDIAESSSAFEPICDLGSTVRHIRIDGFIAPESHKSTQIAVGFGAAPEGSQPAPGAGELRLLFYGGGIPFVPPIISVDFDGAENQWTEGADFVHTLGTICVDIFYGDADGGPGAMIWVDGQNDADCLDPATLNEGSAWGAHRYATDAGTVNTGVPVYVRQSADQAATVVLSDTPAAP